MDEDESVEEEKEDEDELPDDVLLEMIRNEKPADTSKRLKVLIFSLSLFLLAGILGWDMEYLVVLAVAIFIHELGHVASMKLLGYTDLSILFIPLLGGGASGKTKVIDSRKEAIVSLSGPLVGIGSSILVLFFSYSPAYKDIFQNYALFSLILNYINILPFYPLDGGRFFNTVLFNRNYRIEFYFKLTTSFALLVIAVFSRQFWLAFFFLLIVLTIPATKRDGRIVEKLRNTYDWSTGEITVKQVGIIKDEVLIQEKYNKYATNLGMLAKRIESIWKKIQQHPMSRKSVMFFMISYALLFIIPIPLFLLIIIIF